MRTSIWFLMTAAAALALGSSLAQAEIIPIGAHFTGQLTGSIVGDSVQITANGSTVSEHGPVIAEATWSPSLIKVMQFVTGQIARLSINHGTFTATTDQGVLTGTLAGVISYVGSTHFRLDAQFQVTGGDGIFAGATCTGELRATVNAGGPCVHCRSGRDCVGPRLGGPHSSLLMLQPEASKLATRSP
jgi:hypothetical protein